MPFSLRARILLLCLLFVATGGAAAGFYLSRSLRDDMNALVRRELMQEARLVKTYLETRPPERFSYKTVDPVIDRLGEQCNARVTVIALDGAVLGDSSVPTPDLPGLENHAARPEVQEALRTTVGESTRYSATLKTDMAYTAVLFRRNGRPAGVVRLALPVTAFDRFKDHALNTALFVLLLGCCGAAIVSVAVSRLVSAPVERMTDDVEKMADGEFSGKPVIPPPVEFKGLTEALEKLTARTRERFLRVTEENARVEAVLSGMTEGVMAIDASGRIMLTNPAFRDMFGADDWSIGRRPIEIIRSAELQDAVDAALARDSPASSTEHLELVLPNTGQTLRVQLAPIRSAPEFLGMVAVFHDITELRRLERVRRDFVANVSHELRTPLTSIKGFTETLLDGALEDANTAQRFVSAIHKHANRLQALIEDLLHLSRLESRDEEPERTPCDLGALSRRVLESLNHRFAAKKQRVQIEIRPVPPVPADEELMEQVLVNLLDNAAKYTPEEGVITVRVYEQAPDVHLEVSDTGIGIPAGALPRIFERFYRVDRARSREMGGTGLGLSIVRHIVEIHGGRVRVDSEAGRGSTFYVTMPAHPSGA